ncbi:HAD-IIIC family phosphatase [Flavobacterium proteolyticum]|uniref:HAD family hydrolase n=1 Tax=Flavobacterium proteolyticum TaxID=2911683 RepID=A0ABR9WRI5_9FLAO|nr:HAD-IIIC family phosphatase [Flavobacterium proteolyticum]MBE9576420.1 HAD family hydrolase [Flavobacterium proteolyticum]
MKDFSQLRKNLKKDFSGFKSLKVAILGDTSTQFLSQAIRGEGFDAELDLQIWEADFNQIEMQVFNSDSEMYAFQPDIIVLFLSSHKLLNKYNKLKVEQQSSLATREIENIEAIVANISSNSTAKIIYYNYNEIDDAVFGSYATKTETSFLYQLRKLNFELMHIANRTTNFYICDLATIQNQVGKANFFHTSVYISTEMVLSLNVLPLVAQKTVDILSVLNGKLKKCVILDLDNTVWGGIIGDDGIENVQIGSLGIGKAFTEFQYWIKKLKNRGIIVAVCSKNTESIAKEPFEKHPDMVLRLEDISVFIANWENKADNIRDIQRILNIGFDSMVFLDDNPFERNLVRENISGITVPELPEDPAEYLEYLYTLNLFETNSFSDEDKERTKLYQIEAQRTVTKQKFTNEDDFLKSLDMISVVASFTKFNIPRVAQLSQRSNQFNLRTVRYTESDIENLAKSNEYATFAFTLEDKFGDNGLIAVVVLKKNSETDLFIESWFMSCRVLKRGMENFMLNTLTAYAKANGFERIIGEYIPTPKNEIVKNHYQNLGFEQENDFWFLPLKAYKERTNYITLKSHE